MQCDKARNPAGMRHKAVYLPQTYLHLMNKYHQILGKILSDGKPQKNKKGNIVCLLNESLSLGPGDLLEIFEGHPIARNKLKCELGLFYARGTSGRQIPRSRDRLVGLLRQHPCKRLPVIL